jgi:hypothetical protein
VGLTTLPPSVSRLSRQCGILDISQAYRPPRPVMGIAFTFITRAERAGSSSAQVGPLGFADTLYLLRQVSEYSRSAGAVEFVRVVLTVVVPIASPRGLDAEAVVALELVGSAVRAETCWAHTSHLLKEDNSMALVIERNIPSKRTPLAVICRWKSNLV